MRRILTVLATGALAMGACAEFESDDSGTLDGAVVAPSEIGDAVLSASDLHEMPALQNGQVELARFIGYADPVNGTMEIQRVFETAEGQRLRTVGQANWCDAMVVQDGTTGSNPDDTVELYTVDGSIGSALPGDAAPAECLDAAINAERPAYDDLYGINGVFCATVGIGNFYDAELANVIAEITYTGDAEHAPTQYPYGNAANPDDVSGTNSPTAADGGMFVFGPLASAGGDNDTREALWTFNNGSNAPFFFEGRITYDATEVCGNDIDDDCDGVVDNDCRLFDTGDECALARDCESGVCPDEVCVEATCDDGVTNGDETGVDCGGSCPDSCLTEWSGIRNNVDIATLEGWSQCHVSNMHSSISAAGVLSSCDGDQLLVACRPTGSGTLRVAAHADRDTMVGTDDGTNRTAGRLINGTRWYYSPSWSWGFFPDGEAVDRYSCDVVNTGNNDRLCFHSSGGNLTAGWRCGSTQSVGGYERIIYESGGGGGGGVGNCFDGVQNGDEDDIDCGGALCPVCAVPTCDDGIENGDELGVDCGGDLCDACACDDGVQNGDEVGVDCGGTYCDPCPFDPQCSAPVNVFADGGRNVTNSVGATCDQGDHWGSAEWEGAGWYRFTGAAGDRMPTSPPPTSRCGTHATGWLNGSHPAVGDGIVSRQVCFHWSGNTCNWNANVQVVNCGDHYRYNLPLTPVCHLRYCGISD